MGEGQFLLACMEQRILLCNRNNHSGRGEERRAFTGQTHIPVWQQCITAILSQALWVGMFTAQSTEH